MDLNSDDSSNEAPAEAYPPSKRACSQQKTDGADQEWHSANDLDAESEWQARLREESGAELRGGDEEDWDWSAILFGTDQTLLICWSQQSCYTMCFHNQLHHTIIRLLVLDCIALHMHVTHQFQAYRAVLTVDLNLQVPFLACTST